MARETSEIAKTLDKLRGYRQKLLLNIQTYDSHKRWNSNLARNEDVLRLSTEFFYDLGREQTLMIEHVKDQIEKVEQ